MRSISRSRSTVRSSHRSPRTSGSPTTSSWTSVLLASLSLDRPLTGQAGRIHEWSAGASSTWADRDFVGAEAGFALRPAGQGRYAVWAAGGSRAGEPAGRAEAVAEFVVNPLAQTGVTLYGGLGASVVAAKDQRGRADLTVLAGIEAPGAKRHGWYVEAGFSGGVLIRAGLRWRSLPPWYD